MSRRAGFAAFPAMTAYGMPAMSREERAISASRTSQHGKSCRIIMVNDYLIY
jgi:hypothetical protein